MKWVILLATFLTVTTVNAVPQGSADANIISYRNDIKPEGYQFQFESSDGISRSEEGVIKNIGTDNEILEVKGSFSYMGPDGKVHTVMYIANENGFQPQSQVPPQSPRVLDSRILSFGEILAG